MLFIIGGKGFVGSAFVRVCQEQGRPFEIVDLDNYDSMRGRRCKLLVNANGNSVKWLSKKEPIKDFDATVRSVRSTFVDFEFDSYLHLSSCDVYADCSSPATTRESDPVDPARQSPYGFHKWLAELCVQHCATRWLILRMGGFVGPGLRKNAIFDILHGERLWLDPESQLQFLHTDDLARIALCLHDEHQRQAEVINVCGEGVVKLADVMSWTGRSVPVESESPRVHYEVSVDQLKSLVPPPRSIETVRHFVEEATGAAPERTGRP